MTATGRIHSAGRSGGDPQHGSPRHLPSARRAGVVLEAGHTYMSQRGMRAHAATVTSALLGTLRTDPRSRAEFFALARVPASRGPM